VVLAGVLEERVRRYEVVPSCEEPQKLRGSMKSRQECRGPSAGKDRLCVFRILR